MVSGVPADPTRNVVEGPAASTDKIAEPATRVSFKLSAAAGRHSHAFAPMQTCGWCSYDSMSIAASEAKETGVSFKLSAAAGRHSHAFTPMQICGWCSYDGQGSE
jgi:hypothetical protein